MTRTFPGIEGRKGACFVMLGRPPSDLRRTVLPQSSRRKILSRARGIYENRASRN